LDRRKTYRRDFMNLAFCGTIAKNGDDHVKSSRLAKSAEEVRGISS